MGSEPITVYIYGRSICMRKWKGFVMLLVVAWGIIVWPNTQKVEAASKYIRIDEFIEYIVKQMGWQIDEKSEQPYIDIAIEKGILKNNDFKDYKAYLTRTDTAVIANRLDEFINLKYGYTDDVYEFLKDCKLYKNILYYSTEGSLYPKGATRETYSEERFHKDVVEPILADFSNDRNENIDLRTGYYYIYDDDGNIIKRYMKIGLTPMNIETLDIDPFDEKSEVIQAWKKIKDGDRKVEFVLNERISDISKIPENKREAVANIVAKGIIKGYSNGMYVQNREFRGNKKITNKGAKDVIQKVINTDLRAIISPDGQLTRTTKLPKNADEYAYILESFPNEYYEMKYGFMFLTDYESGVLKRDEYAYPKDVNYEYLYQNFYKHQIDFSVEKYDYFDITMSNAKKYLHYLFNVDYRTVDDEWKEGLATSFCQYELDDRVPVWINRYLDAMKKNHTIVECDKIAIDNGAIYDSRGYLLIRVYVRYKVTVSNINANGDEILYGSGNYLSEIRNGEWRHGIFDIRLGSRYTDNGYQWGVNAQNGISDWVYEESFK